MACGCRNLGTAELTELYKELQLLRLKYDHLTDICRKLIRSWPNRESNGRLVATQEPSTKEEKQTSHKRGTHQLQVKDQGIMEKTCEDTENPDLKQLENILRKAQKIKLSDKEEKSGLSRKCATDSCKKAAKVYQPGKMKEKYSIDSVKSSQQRRSSSKTVRSKMKGGHITKQSSGTSSVKPSIPVSSVDISTARKAKTHSSECVPSVKIVNHVAKSSKRHSKMTEGTVKNPPFYSTSQGSNDSSSANCVEPQEEEMKFDLLRDGSKLCMPAKYSTLCNTLSKMKIQLSSQGPDPSTEAMKEHFVKRLIPQGKEVPSRALQLLLAQQEYQLMIDELEELSPQELAASKRSEAQSVGLGMKEKLEVIIARGSTLEEELRHPIPTKSLCDRPHILTTKETAPTVDTSRVHSSHDCGVGVAKHPPPECFPNRSLRYSSLTDLLHLVELEHKHRMLRIEVQLLKFCTEVILPKYEDEKMTTTSIQILSELAGKPKPIFVCDK